MMAAHACLIIKSKMSSIKYLNYGIYDTVIKRKYNNKKNLSNIKHKKMYLPVPVFHLNAHLLRVIPMNYRVSKNVIRNSSLKALKDIKNTKLQYHFYSIIQFI